MPIRSRGMNKQGAFFQALGGQLVDLYRLVSFKISVPHSVSKLRNINALRKKTGARVMIETGTYLGVTAMRCSRFFERVYTIELDQALAKKASDWLRSRGNVEVIQGDALQMLPQVLARSDVSDVLIFLDGHFSGGVTAHGDHAEPAVLEVEALVPFKEKIRGVIVDDWRCFGWDAGWPKKSELIASIERCFGDEFETMIHLDQVLISRRRVGERRPGDLGGAGVAAL
jgi:hypothetical protein